MRFHCVLTIRQVIEYKFLLEMKATNSAVWEVSNSYFLVFCTVDRQLNREMGSMHEPCLNHR